MLAQLISMGECTDKSGLSSSLCSAYGVIVIFVKSAWLRSNAGWRACSSIDVPYPGFVAISVMHRHMLATLSSVKE